MAKNPTKQEKEKVNSYIQVMTALSKEIGKEIKTDDLFYVALEEVVRIEETTIEMLWKQLIDDVTKPENKENTVSVRGHGRNGSGNDVLTGVLETVFGRTFKIDKTNNAQPKKILEQNCGKNFLNYQISHLFERRTNNPLLFGAPWMICYVPKIIDPFTGHESKGFSHLKDAFIDKLYNMNKKYIDEYNEIIMPYWIKFKEHKANFQYDTKEGKKKIQESVLNSLIYSLAPIEIEFEKLSQKKRQEEYLTMFKDIQVNYDGIL